MKKEEILAAEIPVKLTLSQRDVLALSKAGKYGVRNSMRNVAKYALEPAREHARRISASGIKRAERKVRRGRNGKTTYVVRGKERKIRAYRAGVRKKGAYAMRGRADSIGDVTLLLSIRTGTDYYNFLANMWEHGWVNKLAQTTHPGNQFMTKGVQGEMDKITARFAKAVRLAVEKKGKRITAADLKGLG